MRPHRSRLFSVLVLVVLTLWSTATAHCMLEAVGWLPSFEAAEAGCCEASDDCSQDACDVVEDENYSAPSDGVQAPAPDLYVDFCLSCLWDASLALANAPAAPDLCDGLLQSPSTCGESLRVANTVVLRC